MNRSIGMGTLALVAVIAGHAAAQDVITKQYDDGGVYEGTFRDGKQHGTGTYRLPNGYVYEGEWVDGEILGEGRAEFPNGSIYEGEFVAGKPEGTGKITFADGGTYEGTWVDGKIDGTGVAVYANGVRYEGEFQDALHHGTGRMESPNGYIYEGGWDKGIKEGTGRIEYPDGAVYEGDLARGVREGSGTLQMPDGLTYDVNQRRKEAEQRLAALERQAQNENKAGPETSRISEIQQELTTLDKKINDAILEADAEKLSELRTQERKLNQEAMEFQLKTVTTQAVSEARYDAFLDKVEADFPEYNPDHESYNDELVTETLELQQAFMAKGQSKMDALTRAIRYVRPQYIREDEPAEKPSLRGKPPARDTSTKKARNQKVAKAQPKSPPSRTSKLDSSEDIDVYNFNDPDDISKLSDKELARLSGDYV